MTEDTKQKLAELVVLQQFLEDNRAQDDPLKDFIETVVEDQHANLFDTALWAAETALNLRRAEVPSKRVLVERYAAQDTVRRFHVFTVQPMREGLTVDHDLRFELSEDWMPVAVRINDGTDRETVNRIQKFC